MNTPHTHPQKHGNPYRVPDGYFAELRNTLRARAAIHPAVASVPSQVRLWQTVRRLVGLSAAFGSLVLLATVGYYFTGYQAQQREQLAASNQQADDLLGYSLYTEDLEELESYAATPDEDEQLLFAEAVTEYLDTYGSVDLTAIIDSNN